MQDKEDGKVIDLDWYRKLGRRPKPARRAQRHTPDLVSTMDTVTQDLHAVASTTLRMVRMARLDLGLPDLEF